MKKLFFSCLPLIFLLIGCSENKLLEPIALTDAELKEKIVGTWTNDYVTIKYKSNNTFTKNADNDYTIGDSTVNQTEVIKGTYDIIDGVLSYTNITEWYSNNAIGGGLIPDFEIKIEGGLLYFYPVKILTRVGNEADSLYGEWYSFNWDHHYIDQLIFGKLEQTYNFDKDSMTVTLGTRTPYDSSGAYYYSTLPFTYSPPELILGQNLTWIVEFHKEQMWLFYKLSQPPTPFRKEM